MTKIIQNIVSEIKNWRNEFQSTQGLLYKKNGVHICKLCAMHLHKGKMEVMTQTEKLYSSSRAILLTNTY